jgi:hypothetical protein
LRSQLIENKYINAQFVSQLFEATTAMRTKHQIITGVVATEKQDVSSALAFGVPVLTTNARNTASRLLDSALGTVGPISDPGSPALSMIPGRQQSWRPWFP